MNIGVSIEILSNSVNVGLCKSDTKIGSHPKAKTHSPGDAFSTASWIVLKISDLELY